MTLVQFTGREESGAAEYESRLVLPGVQALFAFQMIAVFNQRYEELEPMERWTQVGALALVTLAIALAVAPAARRCLAEKGGLLDRASCFLSWATVFVAAAVGSELYLVIKQATDDHWFGSVLGVTACAVFAWVWFRLPMGHRSRMQQ